MERKQKKWKERYRRDGEKERKNKGRKNTGGEKILDGWREN